MRKLHSCLLSALSPSHILCLHIYFSSTTREIVKRKYFSPLYKIFRSIILKVLDAILLIVLPAQIYIYGDKPQGIRLKE